MIRRIIAWLFRHKRLDKEWSDDRPWPTPKYEEPTIIDRNQGMLALIVAAKDKRKAELTAPQEEIAP